MSLAHRLDAADGVIDGRYFGRPIVEAARVPAYPAYPAYRTSAAAALDAADGVIDGRYYGRQIVETGRVPAYRTSAATALDAADGVIDGRYYGRPIVETAGYGVAGYSGYASPQGYYPGSRVVSRSGYTTSTAAALDAADGVIDGKYYGRPIVETAAVPRRYGGGYLSGAPLSGSVTRRGYLVDPYYGSAGYAGGYYPGGSVTRLGRTYYDDAALGYGRYSRYGYGGSVTRLGRRYYDDSAITYGGPSTLGLSGSVTRLGGRVYDAPISGYGAYPRYRSTTAAALDAADGVIDGRFYGRPIVERRAGAVLA